MCKKICKMSQHKHLSLYALNSTECETNSNGIDEVQSDRNCTFPVNFNKKLSMFDAVIIIDWYCTVNRKNILLKNSLISNSKFLPQCFLDLSKRKKKHFSNIHKSEDGIIIINKIQTINIILRLS